jgi:hypothetical protein
LLCVPLGSLRSLRRSAFSASSAVPRQAAELAQTPIPQNLRALRASAPPRLRASARCLLAPTATSRQAAERAETPIPQNLCALRASARCLLAPTATSRQAAELAETPIPQNLCALRASAPPRVAFSHLHCNLTPSRRARRDPQYPRTFAPSAPPRDAFSHLQQPHAKRRARSDPNSPEPLRPPRLRASARYLLAPTASSRQAAELAENPQFPRTSAPSAPLRVPAPHPRGSTISASSAPWPPQRLLPPKRSAPATASALSASIPASSSTASASSSPSPCWA